MTVSVSAGVGYDQKDKNEQRETTRNRRVFLIGLNPARGRVPLRTIYHTIATPSLSRFLVVDRAISEAAFILKQIDAK